MRVWLRNFSQGGDRILLLNPPNGYPKLLGKLPPHVEITEKTNGEEDLIQLFVTSRRQLLELLPSLRSLPKPAGKLWITYPKGPSKTKTDVNKDINS
jgi:hypothetical protein